MRPSNRRTSPYYVFFFFSSRRQHPPTLLARDSRSPLSRPVLSDGQPDPSPSPPVVSFLCPTLSSPPPDAVPSCLPPSHRTHRPSRTSFSRSQDLDPAHRSVAPPHSLDCSPAALSFHSTFGSSRPVRPGLVARPRIQAKERAHTAQTTLLSIRSPLSTGHLREFIFTASLLELGLGGDGETTDGRWVGLRTGSRNTSKEESDVSGRPSNFTSPPLSRLHPPVGSDISSLSLSLLA